MREIADLTKRARRRRAARRLSAARRRRRSATRSSCDGEDVRLEDEARRFENAEELRVLASGIAGALDGEEDTVLEKLAHVQRPLAAHPAHRSHARAAAGAVRHRLLRARSAGARARGVRGARRSRSVAARRRAPPPRSALPADEEVRRDARRRDRDGRARRAPSSISSTRRARHPAARGARARGAQRARGRRGRELTALRASAAERLARAVDEVLARSRHGRRPLSTCALMPLREIGPDGAEDVEFRVALNVGHEPRPLRASRRAASCRA